MIRQIIKIDEEKCNGCGLCVTACHEGAIGIVKGKAKLLRDDYCDGLGDCLPVCPTNALSFEEREALDYDEEAVKSNMEKNNQENQKKIEKLPCGCPGSNSKVIVRESKGIFKKEISKDTSQDVSQLQQWPVQIKLIPVNATYFNNAHLLIAADCTAYAYGNFHNEFMKNKVTIIGCPKLDEGDYAEKLTNIIKSNNIKSITVARMEVPCCSGIEKATIKALKDSDKMIPWSVVTISKEGIIIKE